MSSTVKVRPANSILFVSDVDGGAPPTPVRGSMILSTASCISFRCFPEQDGPTEVTLGPAIDVKPNGPPSYEGDLETTKHKIVVSTVEGQTVLEADVPKSRSRVRVWLSHPQWPERVTIGYE